MGKINFLVLVLAALLMASNLAQAADVAGRVGYMSGTLVAQRADGTIRVLGPKSEVLAGDTLVTAKDSYAQVRMNDGAQMTLRPHSNLKIESYQFRKEEPQSDNAALRLLKGGFRTLSGLIGKRGNPDAYQLHASSSTIGIRGTDFTSRLCATKDCQDDEEAGAKQAVKPQVAQPQMIGRVMLTQGELSARDAGGKERKLGLGAPVYEGDVLMTGAKSHAVVAFRDEGRVSLQENTVFHVEKFKYDKPAAQENAVLRLLRGGVRVVTGLIGHVKRDNYQFRVANATIGIRGTGFDAWCNGPCASGAENPGAMPGKPLDGAGVYVWAGEVALTTPGGSFTVATQQAAIIARDTGKPAQVLVIPPGIMDNSTPRPDSIPVDTNKVFGAELNAGDPGLYVTVHDGNVIMAQDGNKLDLGHGETGFASDQSIIRLATPPAFMSGDKQLDPTGSGVKTQKSGGIPEGGCKL
jgi:hypothetical protein